MKGRETYLLGQAIQSPLQIHYSNSRKKRGSRRINVGHTMCVKLSQCLPVLTVVPLWGRYCCHGSLIDEKAERMENENF